MSSILLLFVQLGVRLYIDLTALNRMQGQLEGSESASRGKNSPEVVIMVTCYSFFIGWWCETAFTACGFKCLLALTRNEPIKSAHEELKLNQLKEEGDYKQCQRLNLHVIGFFLVEPAISFFIVFSCFVKTFDLSQRPVPLCHCC